MNDVVVPETQTLRLVKENGDMILEDDVVSLDLLMAEAQEGLDMGKRQDQRFFIINFAKVLSETFKKEVSPSMAYLLSQKIDSVGQLLKKSIETLRSSSSTTEAPSET